MTPTRLDVSVLATLREIMGDDYGLLIDTYLTDSAHRLAQLQGAASPQALREAAHSFKGSSSNMGAMRLAGWCGQLEHLPLDAPSEQVVGLMSEIVEEFTAVQALFLDEQAVARAGR